MRIEEEVAAFLLQPRRILITSHERPDGDSIGSQLAMAEALEQLGKEVAVVNKDPMPPNYRRLPGASRIRLAPRVEGRFDALLILECNNLERSGVAGLEGIPAVNIDHHPVNDHYGVLNWIDPEAAAVAEMLLELLKRMPVRITPTIAANLYAGILTDTGSFQFNNTRPATFRAAADLVEAGADPAWVAEEVLLSQSEARLRLIARLIDTMGFDSTRQIAWILLTRKMLEETGAQANDTEGLVNYPLSVEGVRICAFFREETENRYRVSLRSKGELDVGRVARELGGGGHRNAAGLTLEGPFEEARDRLVRALQQLLESEGEGESYGAAASP
ncbi:MAG: bifunctional oligoribonuclease/PAP phosphatase NrnA [Acidobacteriota bacterium]